MEVLGIAVVVVLILIGVIFVMKSSKNTTSDTLLVDFNRKQMNSNHINTILETNSRDCNGLTFTEMIQKYYTQPYYLCNSTNTVSSVLKDDLTHISNETLNKWGGGVPYDLRLYKKLTDKKRPDFQLTNKGCNSTDLTGKYRAAIPKLYPIPLENGASQVILEVSICY